MPGPDANDITLLLEQASRGDPRAVDELLPLVYRQLRARERQEMARERTDHTLQPTALVHEAYLRLVGTRQLTWDSRAHFYVAAAEAMRRILIEYARKRGRQKRGGDLRQVTLDSVPLVGYEKIEEILSVDDAIRRLEQRDKRMADVVKLRFYAGLSEAVTAAVLEVTDRTVRREWAMARAWLLRALGKKDGRQA